MIQSRLSFLFQVWNHLVRPYWTSSERWVAAGLLSAYLVLMAATIYLAVRINYWSNDFYSALQELNLSAFLHLLLVFTLLACLSITCFIVKHYFLQRLEIKWRAWMTHHLIYSWTQERRYYALQLQGRGTDNPDQRISEDISQFINTSLNLVLGFLKHSATLFSFLGILWALSGTLHVPLGTYTLSIPGYMFWGALIYAVGGTFVSIYVGRPLIHLYYNQQKYEANFRYSLVRFRENVEGIALYKGEAEERNSFGDSFSYIMGNFNSIIRRMLGMNTWLSFYGQFNLILPALLAAPRLFSKEIAFGGFMQILGAFEKVSEALAFFVDNYVGITVWRATTNRLLEFKLSLESLPPSPLEHAIHGKEEIHVTCDTISLPDGTALAEDLALRFIKGTHTLITGPTGIGKSTLARVLAGLWPYGEGSVKIPQSGLMFLPQKPYMPLGTLETALRYPMEHAPQKDLQNILAWVGLENFSGRLNEVNEWSRVLSLGEQQRVAIARALLNKPEWLILDESTSAMDEEAEAYLYGLLKTHLPNTTLISIGHRQSLKAHHGREISLGTEALGIKEKAA